MSIPTNDIDLNRIIANKLAVRQNVSNRYLRSYENILKSQYKIALNEIQKELGVLYSKFKSDGELFWTEYNQFNRKKAIEKQIREILRGLNVKNVNVYGKAIKGQFQDGYYSTQFAHETGMGLSFQFPLLNNEQIQSALLNPVDAIGWGQSSTTNTEVLNTKVRRSIANSMIKGEPLQKAARQLSKELTIGYNKSIRIVRTETHRARQMGNSLNYEKTRGSFERLGIKRGKSWDATQDSKTRPSHGNADGTLANEEGMFELFGATFEGPGLSGMAEHDIECRCVTVSKVEGFTSQTRFDNESKEIIPYTNFADWAKARGLSKNIYNQKYLMVA